MKKFRFISVLMLAAAAGVVFSCSKKSSSEGEEEKTETFQTINAAIFYSNSTLAPSLVNMSVGGTITLYVGNGSTKEIFSGPVMWTATGNARISMSAIQKTVGQTSPMTKASPDYTTVSATTNANTVLKITASDDGMMSLSAKDAVGNSKVLMINIFPKE